MPKLFSFIVHFSWALVSLCTLVTVVVAMVVAVVMSVPTFEMSFEARADGDNGEALGTIVLSDLFLEPSFIYREPNTAAFDLGPSYLAATWTRDQVISALVKLGSKTLIGTPARYGLPATGDQLGFIEGYAQADSEYGRFRLGLVPIPFGLEGGDAERRLQFPRSLMWREARYLPLRDFGASYRIANAGWFTDWAIHNGEGGPDLDNNLWFTGRWGWEGGRFIRLGVSGSVGRTSPSATDPAGTDSDAEQAQAGLNVDQASKVRVVNAFIDWQALPVKLQTEGTLGDTIQQQDDGSEHVIKFRAFHADLTVEGGSSTTWLARYDTMVPRNDLPTGQITELTSGVAWRSRYGNSVLYLLGTKRIQTNVSADVHIGQVIWRITPTTSSFPMRL